MAHPRVCAPGCSSPTPPCFPQWANWDEFPPPLGKGRWLDPCFSPDDRRDRGSYIGLRPPVLQGPPNERSRPWRGGQERFSAARRPHPLNSHRPAGAIVAAQPAGGVPMNGGRGHLASTVISPGSPCASSFGYLDSSADDHRTNCSVPSRGPRPWTRSGRLFHRPALGTTLVPRSCPLWPWAAPHRRPVTDQTLRAHESLTYAAPADWRFRGTWPALRCLGSGGFKPNCARQSDGPPHV